MIEKFRRTVVCNYARAKVDVFNSFIILSYSQAIYTVLQINLLKILSATGSLKLALTYLC